MCLLLLGHWGLSCTQSATHQTLSCTTGRVLPLVLCSSQELQRLRDQLQEQEKAAAAVQESVAAAARAAEAREQQHKGVLGQSADKVRGNVWRWVQTGARILHSSPPGIKTRLPNPGSEPHPLPATNPPS